MTLSSKEVSDEGDALNLLEKTGEVLIPPSVQER